MELGWTAGQEQRLKELGYSEEGCTSFETASSRDTAFISISNELEHSNRKQITDMISVPRRTDISDLGSRLASELIANGFIEVSTPTIMSKNALSKMTIGEDHPLYRQVFFIDGKRCLRPMLAPNLYVIMKNLRGAVKGPIRFFEIGSCFRKESHSSGHLEEFTMLNLVEMSPADDPTEDLKKFIGIVMDVAGLDYELETETSDVYRSTTDVIVDGNEMASGAVGPHPLDEAHGINEPWCGVGFGLERLLMAKKKAGNIRKSARSLVYLNGVRMDV